MWKRVQVRCSAAADVAAATLGRVAGRAAPWLCGAAASEERQTAATRWQGPCAQPLVAGGRAVGLEVRGAADRSYSPGCLHCLESYRARPSRAAFV